MAMAKGPCMTNCFNHALWSSVIKIFRKTKSSLASGVEPRGGGRVINLGC